MRGAKFGHCLPHQVGEVAGAPDPVQQRPVALEHRVPVHAGHAGVPEVAPHQPARLGEGVLPQGGRVGLEPGPGQVDGDRLGRAVVLLVLGRQDPQLVVILDHQPGAVTADVEPVELADQLGIDLFAVLEMAAATGKAGEVTTLPVPQGTPDNNAVRWVLLIVDEFSAIAAAGVMRSPGIRKWARTTVWTA